MRPRTTSSVHARVAHLEQLQRREASGIGCDEFVIDLLADLRHYCDGHSLDFGKLDRHAYGLYIEERQLVPGRRSMTSP